MSFPRMVLDLPLWVEELTLDPDREYPADRDRMRLVIELSRSNVEHGTGGPFGAGVFDLSTNRLVAPGVNLVTTANLSTAHAWSGGRRLACGARDEDAREIGFDEGPKMEGWISSLEQRGISVVRDVCREEAAAVLKQYAEGGGVIYNARQGE